MRSNCNLELRLVVPYHGQPMTEETGENTVVQQGQEQLKCVCNGKDDFVCDAAEVQARAIILLASRGMEDKLTTPGAETCCRPQISPSQLYNNSPTGLSIKRSLQRFLQERQDRIQATSPYTIHRSRQGTSLFSR